jgi:ribose 5-phosphate isomerase B
VRIALGSDHAGYELKSVVAKHLVEGGHDVIDFGTDSHESVDYPAFCAAAARSVVAGDADFGIVFGGSGQGEQIAANKIHGARAALCSSEFMARLAREHNDANVLSLGGRVLGDELALAVVDVFLATGFEGERHARRVGQITDIEREECKESATARERGLK